jgi:hypothetical protein
MKILVQCHISQGVFHSSVSIRSSLALAKKAESKRIIHKDLRGTITIFKHNYFYLTHSVS